MSTPFITVAMCTHNHSSRLTRTLCDLRLLDAPDCAWEFLVVDNGSTDNTPLVLSADAWRLPGIETRIVVESTLGVSHARNRAIKEARGEYVLFMDDDETPEPAWLSNYAKALRTYRPDAAGGRIEVMFEGCARPCWLQDELLGFLGKLDHGGEQWLTEASTPLFCGNFAFSRAVFDKIGDFDTGLGRHGALNFGGEDTEIFQRLIEHRCRVRWLPDAVIHHRIEAPKLTRGYFLDLHYRQGLTEGARNASTRRPPPYLHRLLLQSAWRALVQRVTKGSDTSLRAEMNAAYYLGYIRGWASEGRKISTQVSQH